MNKRGKRREYEGDVAYEVWRRGGNPDTVSPDRIDDYYWEGVSPESAAARELRRRRQVQE